MMMLGQGADVNIHVWTYICARDLKHQFGAVRFTHAQFGQCPSFDAGDSGTRAKHPMDVPAGITNDHANFFAVMGVNAKTVDELFEVAKRMFCVIVFDGDKDLFGAVTQPFEDGRVKHGVTGMLLNFDDLDSIEEPGLQKDTKCHEEGFP